MKVDFHIDRKKAEERLGINPDGRVQAMLDASLISHMRRKMPKDNGIMIANTVREKSGLILVKTPYAHYMNEGIMYVMPHNGKSAYYKDGVLCEFFIFEIILYSAVKIVAFFPHVILRDQNKPICLAVVKYCSSQLIL